MAALFLPACHSTILFAYGGFLERCTINGEFEGHCRVL